MKVEVGIIRSAFRGLEEGADIAPGGLAIDDWSMDPREINRKVSLWWVAMASLTFIPYVACCALCIVHALHVNFSLI